MIDYNSIVSDFDSQRDPRATICHGKSASKASLSRAQAAKPAGDRYNHVLTLSQIYNVVLLRRAVPAEGALCTPPLRDNLPVETTNKEGSLQD